MEQQVPMSAIPPGRIEVTVNGEKCLIPETSTVAEVVESYGLDPTRVAVELDRRIIRQPDRGNTRVRAGAEIEIVQFVGGG